MRQFKREASFSPCTLIADNRPVVAFVVNFSRMGAAISTQYALTPKRYVSIMYQNEKNETVRILTYVIHSTKKDHYYISGLQFIGFEQSRQAG